ncbi:MAG: helix-turn-helix domain-containing protein, partial [Oscillospiraceae bacterium]|nr:helix-turn-helix domain-containing protein [Oscillospiraceae bacterium]
MFNQAAFGEKLKNHRKLKNLTQEEVAGKIGVSGQAVSKWEKGECLPDCYNLKMLGKVYQVSVDTLLDSEEMETLDS